MVGRSSVDPPSITTTSRRGYSCRKMLSRLARRKRPWLYDGTTTLIDGTASFDASMERRPPQPRPGRFAERLAVRHLCSVRFRKAPTTPALLARRSSPGARDDLVAPESGRAQPGKNLP